MNLEIRRFEEELIGFINSKNIPIEVKRLVMLEVTAKVEKAADESIKEAINAESLQQDLLGEQTINEHSPERTEPESDGLCAE